MATDEKSKSGSVSQLYGFVDPDPYQNVTDPLHCPAGSHLTLMKVEANVRWSGLCDDKY